MVWLLVASLACLLAIALLLRQRLRRYRVGDELVFGATQPGVTAGVTYYVLNDDAVDVQHYAQGGES